jgi:hypothetical protein
MACTEVRPGQSLAQYLLVLDDAAGPVPLLGAIRTPSLAAWWVGT